MQKKYQKKVNETTILETISVTSKPGIIIRRKVHRCFLAIP